MNESPGVADLLGVLAYAELSAFTRMTEDAALLAPSLADRTALIIAHRLSTVLIADRVLVVADGRIIQDGSPADLLPSFCPAV